MISVVVPVFNSASVVGETIDRIVSVCRAEGWAFEVIAVDDGSDDGSLEVLRGRAVRHPGLLRVIAHTHNAGQHAALLTGLRAATGGLVVTMDDDLQHPPEALPALVACARAGHDAVYARFPVVRHAAWRRPGSAFVRWMDRAVFDAPRGLTVTSYRLLTRDVVDRVCAYAGTSPYIRGQMLLASRRPANVDVPHEARRDRHSSYSPSALVAFVARVLLEWSHVPAWTALASGVVLTGGALVVLPATPLASVAPLPLLHGVALVALGAVGLRRRLPQDAQPLRPEPGGEFAHPRR